MPKLLESRHSDRPLATFTASNSGMDWGDRDLPLQSVPPSIYCPLNESRTECGTLTDRTRTLHDHRRIELRSLDPQVEDRLMSTNLTSGSPSARTRAR
jgi:hypothetical protein